MNPTTEQMYACSLGIASEQSIALKLNEIISVYIALKFVLDPYQNAPKLKVAIVGSGLAGLSAAVELLDQG